MKTENEEIIKGFKGFDSNLKCRDFQYKFNAEYKTNEDIKICKSGFHFCENPLDIFGYYPPNTSKYAEVEGLENIQKEKNSDSKVTTSYLKIKAELTLNGLLNAGVKFILDKVNFEVAPATNTGYHSAATNTGDRSAATNTGYHSAATNTGDQSAATNTGDHSAATNTGNHSAAIVEGKDSFACGLGIKNKAKGIKGCYLILSEWKEKDNEWNLSAVKTVKIDGKKIKENVFYQLINGKFTEVK